MNLSKTEIIIDIHRQAFGDEGEETSKLAASFLARPDTVSVNAERDGKIVGNVLFTPFIFEEYPHKKCYLLAPIGVLPEYQHGHGVGKELMKTGIQLLKDQGCNAIFVLGVPTYYPRYGFEPTAKQTPYPELLTMPEAWMVLELSAGVLTRLNGVTKAVEPFMIPQLWDTSGRG